MRKSLLIAMSLMTLLVGGAFAADGVAGASEFGITTTRHV